MQRVLRIQRLTLGMLALLAGLTSLAGGAAMASGGYGGTTVYGTPRTGSVDHEAVLNYNRGKSLYETRMACADCPLAGVSLNEGLARELLFNKRGVIFTHDEIYALEVYLKRRFRL